jgi:hypothetical protein
MSDNPSKAIVIEKWFCKIDRGINIDIKYFNNCVMVE